MRWLDFGLIQNPFTRLRYKLIDVGPSLRESVMGAGPEDSYYVGIGVGTEPVLRYCDLEHACLRR
jgi:hypothetical protein